MNAVRWGIVGCGDVTEVKSGPALQKADRSSLVAVMRRDATLAEDYARRHGVPRWYADADRLIGDPDVDAVYVATPPSSHCEYVLKAAAAGKPVYVEKPMALNAGECSRMLDACRAAGVPLFVAYYRRRLPRFVKVQQLLASGAIGEVRFVTVTQFEPPTAAEAGPELPWRVRPEISGGGKFLDLGSHTLDLLDFLFGPVVSASGYATNQGGLYAAEDLVTAHLRFASGVQGTGVWCFSAQGREDVNRIVGNRGEIRFSTFGSDPIVLLDDGGRHEFAFDNPKHIQQPLIQSVVDELTGVGTCPSTGVTGARTSWVMDQVTSLPAAPARGAG